MISLCFPLRKCCHLQRLIVLGVVAPRRDPLDDDILCHYPIPRRERALGSRRVVHPNTHGAPPARPAKRPSVPRALPSPRHMGRARGSPRSAWAPSRKRHGVVIYNAPDAGEARGACFFV